MSAATRLVGIDAARGLALIGMMATHVMPARDSDGSTSTAYLLASGRASALFALLAGLSLALVYGRTRPPAGSEWPRVAAAIALRAAVVGFVGLLLGELDSGVAVILVHYALLFLAGALFICLPARTLLPLAVLWAVGAPVLSHLLRRDLTDPPRTVPSLESLAEPGRLFADLALTGYYPVLTWLAYLLAGMALGRTDLAARAAGPRIAATGAGLLVVSWGADRFFRAAGGVDALPVLPPQFHGSTPTNTWWFLTVPVSHSMTPVNIATNIGSALLVLGVCLVVARVAPPALAALAALGSMTFTLYTLHVIALAYDWGPHDATGRWLVHVVAGILLASVWRTLVGRGPLEEVAHLAARLPGPRVTSGTR